MYFYKIVLKAIWNATHHYKNYLIYLIFLNALLNESVHFIHKKVMYTSVINFTVYTFTEDETIASNNC